MMPRAASRRLANGLRIVTVPMRQSATTAVLVGVRAGTRSERPDRRGLAHLTEHLVFKGSRHYPRPQDIENAVAEIGGQINATTANEFTCYTVHAQAEGAGQALEVLADMLLRPLLPEAELEPERKVIGEEIRHVMQDHRNWSVFMLQNLMWRRQQLSWDVEGSLAALSGLNATHVQEYLGRWYRSDNTVIVLVGGGRLDRLAQRAAELFRARPKAGQPPAWRRSRLSARPRSAHRATTADSDSLTIRVGVPGPPFGRRVGETVHLINLILGQGSTSRLYGRLREQLGLVYDVETDSAFFSDAGMVSTVTETGADNARQVLDIILEEQARLASQPIEAGELKRAKAEYVGNLSFLTHDLPGLAKYYMENILIGGRLRQLDDHRRHVLAVTAEELRRLTGRLYRARPYLVSIGPRGLRLPSR